MFPIVLPIVYLFSSDRFVPGEVPSAVKMSLLKASRGT